MIQKLTGLRINGWKWAFLILLMANLAFFTVLSNRLLQVREPATEKLSKVADDDVQVGLFTTDREAINQYLTLYLDSFQTKDFKYQVFVGSTTILFEGAYQLFGYQVPLYVYFSPYQLEDGTIRLDIDSFSVGTLPLPQKEVLQYIKSTYEIPDFVTIDAKKETIHIDLTALDNDQGIYIKAKTIDLLNDQIAFEIWKKS
jgi:uncharacterized protein YpmS